MSIPKQKVPLKEPEKHIVGDTVYSNKNYKFSSIPESILNKINKQNTTTTSTINNSNNSKNSTSNSTNNSNSNGNSKAKLNLKRDNNDSSSSSSSDGSGGVKMNSNYSILKFNKIEKEINDPFFHINKKIKLSNHNKEIGNIGQYLKKDKKRRT